ncbi:hypothetical protein J437_LFUL017296 [Ladona fulva]|uniref:DUF5641 domain-containing protein n=1 Tax=Ladona fulva TaxID=123851 RepID=A0A8K0KNL4_LADFU|nr:hypothetical protein J437_LFUL017296 [Ladona fulva]
MEFLESRIRALHMITPIASSDKGSAMVSKFSSSEAKSFYIETKTDSSKTIRKCAFCSVDHYIGVCPRFQEKTPAERKDEARRLHKAVEENLILKRFSSLTRLIRVLAYCLRFIARCRRSQDTETIFLSTSKLAAARCKAIQLTQSFAFAEELKLLGSGKPLPRRNSLRRLNTILDEVGIMHVGGRLKHSTLSFSTKHHLLRVVGEHTLTFEEFSTVLVQIEACLNSRPLYPLSSDQDDLNALTPAQYLIGDTLFLIPESEYISPTENRLSRWQPLQRMQLNFWKRWSREYLHHLQQRSRWRDPKENFAVGQLVVVRDERYPPSKWPLGRITKVHPGPDGHSFSGLWKYGKGLPREPSLLADILAGEHCQMCFEGIKTVPVESMRLHLWDGGG